MTIIEAIKEVMRANGAPMSAKQAYDAIVLRQLYDFHAHDPAGVVLAQIRRHCEGIDFPTAGSTKHFKLVADNKFWPLDQPKRISRKARQSAAPKPTHHGKARSLDSTLRELQALHARYVNQLEGRILMDLRRLSPAAFETFARELLGVYGFEDTNVTQVSGDGGIDGYGKLRVGLAHLNVAFQCKRWRKGNIQRTEIDRFRGAIQGDFEQGIFFATTSFSKGAIDASIKRGAVPIVLVDSEAIVDLMIEKHFGIQAENLIIPTYALDLALTPENKQASSDSDLTSAPNRTRRKRRVG